MKKRLTDIEKWKDSFFKELPPVYKLLWLYVNDECDSAGIWNTDFNIARLRIGMSINELKAIEYFKDHIHVFDTGKRWFLTDFITFQYKKLTLQKPATVSVLETLDKNGLLSILPFKVLPDELRAKIAKEKRIKKVDPGGGERTEPGYERKEEDQKGHENRG